MKKTKVAKFDKAQPSILDQAVTSTLEHEQPEIESIEDLLKKQPIAWSSLDELRESLNPHIMDFLGQMHSISTNTEIINNLGDQRPMFDKFLTVFNNDMSEFSLNVERIRGMHANYSGQVTNDEEYSEYTKIAFEYQMAYMNIVSIVTPVMVQLIDVVSTVQANIKKQQEPQDVEVTEVTPTTVTVH